MRDATFVLAIVGFFTAAAALVSACDRIVGPDPAPASSDGAASEATNR